MVGGGVKERKDVNHLKDVNHPGDVNHLGDVNLLKENFQGRKGLNGGVVKLTSI